MVLEAGGGGGNGFAIPEPEIESEFSAVLEASAPPGLADLLCGRGSPDESLFIGGPCVVDAFAVAAAPSMSMATCSLLDEDDNGDDGGGCDDVTKEDVDVSATSSCSACVGSTITGSSKSSSCKCAKIHSIAASVLLDVAKAARRQPFSGNPIDINCASTASSTCKELLAFSVLASALAEGAVVTSSSSPTGVLKFASSM